MSALGLVFWSRMRAHALMPIGDPRFEQALQFPECIRRTGRMDRWITPNIAKKFRTATIRSVTTTLSRRCRAIAIYMAVTVVLLVADRDRHPELLRPDV